jgi:hypothetical protein
MTCWRLGLLVALTTCSGGSSSNLSEPDPTGDDDQVDPATDGSSDGGKGGASTGPGGVSDEAGPGPGAGGTTGGTLSNNPNADAWPTYGHDAQRTSAANANIPGEVHTVWRHVPTLKDTTVLYVMNAVAQEDGLFLAFDIRDDQYPHAVGWPGIERLSVTDGKRVWIGAGGRDIGLGNWLTLVSGKVVRNDDGLTAWEATTGSSVFGNSNVDSWGQIVPDGDRLYCVNTSDVDGPPIWVAAFALTGNKIWSTNTGGLVGGGGKEHGIANDAANAIALDGDTLFSAHNYKTTGPVPGTLDSGYYALAATSGSRRWFVAGKPSSAISVGDGLVFGIEDGGTLEAHNQSDGAVVWSQPIDGAGRQAPVLAQGRVIVAGASGVAAFDAITGAVAWRSPRRFRRSRTRRCRPTKWP